MRNYWPDRGAEIDLKRLNQDQTRTIQEITIDETDPGGITTGPDGNLWFTYFGASKSWLFSGSLAFRA